MSIEGGLPVGRLKDFPVVMHTHELIPVAGWAAAADMFHSLLRRR
jgi:hypothetical protein